MRRAFLVSGILLALGAALCTTLLFASDNENGHKSAGAIVLGGIFNLKGSQAVLDIPSALGAQLAANQINESGGLLGKPLDLGAC
jgi:ABC-type branched-subunit amino acid transport system substrate-binding protein